MPEISVVVPVYKAESYIDLCVASILGQSFQNLEVILVDDGSPDRCGAICDEYAEKDSRVHVIHQKNAGVSAARNAGIEWILSNSDSSWITFIDSDDWIHRDFLKILHTLATENDAQVSACGLYWAKAYCEDAPAGAVEACAMEPEQALVHDSMIGRSCCAKIYARSLLTDIRFPVGIRYEDASISYLIALAAKRIVVSPARLYYYYENVDSFTRVRWTEERLIAIGVHEHRLSYFLEKGYLKAYRKEQEIYLDVLTENLQTLMHLVENDAICKEHFEKIREKLRIAFRKYESENGLRLKKENMWWFVFAAPTNFVWKMAKAAQKAYHKMKN